MIRGAPDSGIVNLRNQIAFAHSGFHFFQNSLMHPFDDARRAEHELNLAFRFYGTAPVHQSGDIRKYCIGKVLLQ